MTELHGGAKPVIVGSFGSVWGALIALGECLAGAELCHSSRAEWGARSSCLTSVRVAVTELVSSPSPGEGEKKCCVLEQWCRIYKSTLCLYPCGINSGCISEEGRNIISLPFFS